MPNIIYQILVKEKLFTVASVPEFSIIWALQETVQVALDDETCLTILYLSLQVHVMIFLDQGLLFIVIAVNTNIA